MAQINALSPTSVSSKVWSALSRTLTSIGSGAPATFSQAQRTAVLASGTLGFNPGSSPNQVWVGTAMLVAGAAGTFQFLLSDSVSTASIGTAAAGGTAAAVIFVLMPLMVGLVKNNDAANTAFVSWAIVETT